MGSAHTDGFDDKIVSMCAGGMAGVEIRGHVADIHGVEVSNDFLTRVRTPSRTMSRHGRTVLWIGATRSCGSTF